MDKVQEIKLSNAQRVTMFALMEHGERLRQDLQETQDAMDEQAQAIAEANGWDPDARFVIEPRGRDLFMRLQPEEPAADDEETQAPEAD